MKTYTTIVFCLCLVFFGHKATGQTSPCTSNTPHFVIDLSGDPGGTAYIAPVARQGLCCGAQSPDKCIMATITLDSNSSGIRFDISSGAVPPGALYYQVGCSSPTQVGEPICLSGVGPHILTFCKPGNNSNGYSITALPKLIVPDTVQVDVGCSVSIGTLGYFVDTSLVWKDLSSTNSAYLSYLDSTRGVDTVSVTPDIFAPDFIEYEICGRLIDTVCQAVSSYMCKSIIVQVNKIIDSVAVTICGNEQYMLSDGSTIDSTGTYVTALASASGCDSIILTELTVNPSYSIVNLQTNCDSALINGSWYFSSQTVIDSFTTLLGCDSIIQTELTINNSINIYLSASDCDSANINGNWYYSSQLVTDSFLTSNACDSAVYTDLIVNYKAEHTESVISCDSANINGNWYFNSQMVIDSFLTSFNCDSIVFTDLTINTSVQTFVSLTACDSALVNNNWYYNSQLITDSFTTTQACDSIVYTELTIYNSQAVYFNRVECDSALVNYKWYYNSQLVIDSFTCAAGCDSIVYTQLVIHNMTSIKNTVNACDSANVNGRYYYTSQTVIDSFYTAFMCDSIITTELTIHPSWRIDNTRTSCDRALINGNWYSRSQIVIDSFSSISGCDSIVYTDLTVNYTDSTFVEVSSCETAFIEGRWYNNTQMIYSNFANQFGCDSVVVTKLSIYKGNNIDITVSACDSFIHNGDIYYTSFEYSDVNQNQYGCDSVTNHFINIHSSVNVYQDLIYCEGDMAYLPDNKRARSAGDYTTYFKTKYGCDSIIHSKVIFNSTEYNQVPDTAKCLGDVIELTAGTGNNIISYEWSNGGSSPSILIKDLGSYYLTVTSDNGCSSKDTIVVENANCPACPVYTPTGFTPNQTNLNDAFSPIADCDFLSYEFEVYNRWGELIFRTNSPEIQWNGEYKGKPVQQGVYLWIVNYTDVKALKPISHAGTITLLR